MKDRLHLARGFLVICLLILVPLLLASLWASNRTIRQLENDTYQTIKGGVTRAAGQFDALFTEYKGRTAALSTDSVLRADFWSQNVNRYQAIKNLARISSYSMDVSVIFLQAPDGTIFSSRGFSGAETFFQRTLQLDAFSLPRLADCLAMQDTAVSALYQENAAGGGYVLLHFPMSLLGGHSHVSVNYLLPFSFMGNLIQMTAEQPMYAALSFADGSKVFVLLHEEKTTVLSALPTAEMAGYTVIDQSIPLMKASLAVYYDPDSLYRSVRVGQKISLALLAAGLLLSALISFFFTVRRTRNLRRLEALAKGSPVAFRFRDEYAFIGGLLTDSAHQIHSLSSRVQDYSDMIRQQNVMLIVSGALRDRQTANQMLAAGGQALTEEYFFIGVMTADGMGERTEEVTRALKNEMLCYLDLKGQKSGVFIGEVPNPDGSGKIRRESGTRFLKALEGAGMQRVRIGMSRVYAELSMAELAFQEAVEAAESPESAGQICCYEELERQEPRPGRMEPENLSAFQDALREKDIKKARKEWQRLNGQIEQTSRDEAGRAYLRYCVLQSLLSVLAEQDDAPEGLLQSAMRINFRDAAEYTAETEKILDRYAADRERKVSPEEIRQYLLENYANPDLSAADVAQFAGINKAHLGMIFKQHFGMTYIEYLSDLRLEKARSLLSETEEPITKIAQEVGYWDHSSFRRKFRARYGMGVAEYRERSQGGA